jgi:acyl-CoA synthetase (AMP-forming)/AMP-acid ligase II
MLATCSKILIFHFWRRQLRALSCKFENLIGRKVDSIELFPASEGFFAFQDKQNERGMLFQLNSGIFYEFIEAEHFFDDKPERISIKDVRLKVNYVMIISTTAGLWAYNVGDTVEFTSLKPYRLIVSGRIKHFISAFGEHVIGKEVEQALKDATKNTLISVNEFTVAPQINPKEGLPYHEWFIEFENEPENLRTFIDAMESNPFKSKTVIMMI